MFAATVEVEKLRGEYVAPALGRVTVGELADAWLERKASDLKPSSYRPLEVSWHRHVKPRWGTTRIVDVDLDAVERWIADMGRTVTEADGTVTKKGSGATVVLRAYGVLAGVLYSAVKARRLTANPARTPENLPRKKPKPRTYLTHDQVAALAAEAKYPTLIRSWPTPACAGRGDRAARRPPRPPRKRLTVIENAVQVDQRMIVGTPKSDESRTVSIPEFLVFEPAATTRGRAGDALLFTDGHGRYLRRPVSYPVGSPARSTGQGSRG